jgi:hypothetical protein
MAAWFQITSNPIVNGSTTYSADGQLIPPQLCVGTTACPQTSVASDGKPAPNYVGSGWNQWESISSGGECGVAFKMLPTVNTDQVKTRLRLRGHYPVSRSVCGP